MVVCSDNLATFIDFAYLSSLNLAHKLMRYFTCSDCIRHNV